MLHRCFQRQYCANERGCSCAGRAGLVHALPEARSRRLACELDLTRSSGSRTQMCATRVLQRDSQSRSQPTEALQKRKVTCRASTMRCCRLVATIELNQLFKKPSRTTAPSYSSSPHRCSAKVMRGTAQSDLACETSKQDDNSCGDDQSNNRLDEECASTSTNEEANHDDA